MLTWLARYARWLHTGMPAGSVEKLPVVAEDGSTRVPGLYVAGDLTGVPLLKMASHGGAEAVRRIVASQPFRERSAGGAPVLDLVIVGAGIAGFAAALEARKLGLRFAVLEASEPFFTIVNFPRGKPIFTYPSAFTPRSELQFGERSGVREGLLEELREQARAAAIEVTRARVERIRRAGANLQVEVAEGPPLAARAVLVAIGRSGSFRRLGVPGEDLDKVSNRLHDPADFKGLDVLVVGGGDGAVETAVAIARAGGRVRLSYRKPELTRPKEANLAALAELASPGGQAPAGGSIQLLLGSTVEAIEPGSVKLRDPSGHGRTLSNQAVFTMIGREAPLGLFRRSGVPIAGERSPGAWLGLALFLLFCTWLYLWKGYGFSASRLDPARWVEALTGLSASLAERASDPRSLAYTLLRSASGRSFYYTLAYSVCVVGFGIARMRRRRTPYVRIQTLALMAIQVLPLFLLPEVLLPWLGRNGWFESGPLRTLADLLFPGYGQSLVEREYWRAYGLVLAWPLMVYNWFTAEPLAGWLVLGFLQSFVLIPLLVYRWGKGAYCGWICSCGALAETLGDAHRHKMPHGPRWNRLNLLGQAVLAFALALLCLRVAGWMLPPGSSLDAFVEGLFPPLLGTYKLGVDTFLAGILGVGLYFQYSGRVWCRFACPLAALMHVYARLGQFRILADKKKCISCNACTAICHQGIDVMAYANKGLPMADPQCVRCSACVAACPTGVLAFGRVEPATGRVVGRDTLAASRVELAEASGAGPHGDARRGS